MAGYKRRRACPLPTDARRQRGVKRKVARRDGQWGLGHPLTRRPRRPRRPRQQGSQGSKAARRQGSKAVKALRGWIAPARSQLGSPSRLGGPILDPRLLAARVAAPSPPPGSRPSHLTGGPSRTRVRLPMHAPGARGGDAARLSCRGPVAPREPRPTQASRLERAADAAVTSRVRLVRRGTGPGSRSLKTTARLTAAPCWRAGHTVCLGAAGRAGLCGRGVLAVRRPGAPCDT